MGKEARLPWAEYQSREARRMHTGRQIANHLRSQERPTLLLDMDGVVVKGDGFYQPVVATLGIVPVLRDLERANVRIGLATSRGDSIIHYLRDNDLKLDGPKILESGQKITIGDTTEYLTHPNHPEFIAAIEERVTEIPGFTDVWDNARKQIQNGEFAFCLGSPQWRGDCITFLWFNSDQIQTSDTIESFRTMFKQLAAEHGLDFDKDVAVSLFHMIPDAKRGNIAMLKITGKNDGKSINKVTAADRLDGSWIFAADGAGDAPFALETKKQNGLVIGIKGSIDDLPEIDEFLREADIILDNPLDLARTLRYTADTLLDNNPIA